MREYLKHFTFAAAILVILAGSNCAWIAGTNIVGTWDVNLTGEGKLVHWVITFTGARDGGDASMDAFGEHTSGTFTRSGKNVTITFSHSMGTITIEWEFEYEDRANGTVVIANGETQNYTFVANRRNVHR